MYQFVWNPFMKKLFLFFLLTIVLKDVDSNDDGKNFIRGRGRGSVSKVSMTSLVSSEIDDIFEDVKFDKRDQYVAHNRNSDNDGLSSIINLTEEEVTVGPSKTIKPNIIQPNNEVSTKESKPSLLDLSGSHKLTVTTPKFWNHPAPLKTLIMPHSLVEKKIPQETSEVDNDLTDEEVMELTKYVEKYISNSDFRQLMKSNLQTETLFATERPVSKTTMKEITSTTTSTTTTTSSSTNKKLHNETNSKEKLKQFKDQFNKWLEELRKKSSNVSKGIEVKDSLNSTINELFVLKSNSTILRKSDLTKVFPANIKILQTGYLNTFIDPETYGKRYINMSSTITLIQDMGKNILIDTGLSSSEMSGKKSIRIEILRKLNELLLSPNDIHYVVITSTHLDHIGNLNEFGNAIIFQNGFIYDPRKSFFTMMDVKNNDYFITPNVKITKEYGDNINVIVKKSKNFKGVVSITGDLFINQYDIFNPSLWKPFSSNVEAQEISRRKTICNTDWIIPGHGSAFKVDIRFKERFC